MEYPIKIAFKVRPYFLLIYLPNNCYRPLIYAPHPLRAVGKAKEVRTTKTNCWLADYRDGYLDRSEILGAMQLYPNDCVLTRIDLRRRGRGEGGEVLYFRMRPNLLGDFPSISVGTIEIRLYFEVVIDVIRLKFISRGLYLDR